MKALSRCGFFSNHISRSLNRTHCNPSRAYHKIQFLDSGSKLYPQDQRFFDKNRNTDLSALRDLAHKLETSPSLQSQICEASFQWASNTDDVTRPEVLKVLGLIGGSLEQLHYAPGKWDAQIPETYPVSSVNMPYPTELPEKIATQEIYSLFSVPTLRHITLRQCNNILNPQGYGRYEIEAPEGFPDMSKAKTSNVEYLSIQDTAHYCYDDLEQLMVLPKGLKVFDCAIGTGTVYQEDISPDPSSFVKALRHQSQSLEQISMDLNGDSMAAGTFGTLLSEFPRLKRISMERGFLAYYRGDPWCAIEDIYDHENAFFTKIHLALPPALEELILKVWIHLDNPARDPTKKWIIDVLSHKKKLYPSLKRVVLWQEFGDRIKRDQGHIREKEVLDFLRISGAAKKYDVQFSFKVTDDRPSFENDSLNGL